MKLTKNNLIKKLGVKNDEVINIIIEYNKQLPILSEDGEGFCVNARDLHNQLKIGRDFSTWIKDRISKYGFIENVDYEVFTKIGENLLGGRPTKEYKITIDMAKEISMITNNENGKITRKYFIYIEKILKKAMEWNMIRIPEKQKYKIMCEELRKYFLRNFNKEPKFYDYSNEADALNLICLGAKAKNIREYIDSQDNNTRDWLEAKYNEYLDKLEDLNTMYLKMNLDKERRYDLIKQGFKALYPDASFSLIKEGDN